jgi:phasin family protein
MINLDIPAPVYTQNLASLLTSALFSNAAGWPRGLPFDLGTALEMQRRNIQAFGEAQQILLAGAQKAARQSSDILSLLVESQNTALTRMASPGTPEDKIARHIELSQKTYQALIRDIRHIQDSVAEALREATDILHHRTQAGLHESRTVLDKAEAKSAAIAEITHRKAVA